MVVYQGVAAARFVLTSQFLDGLAPSELEVILARARRQHFLARSIIVNQGDPADRLFLLTSGRARYFYMTDDGQKILLLWLTPGAIFGGAALLRTPSFYLVSTATVKNSSVLVWDRATLRGLVPRYPGILDNALLCAAGYLTWYVAAHVALANRKARGRLARVLLYLAETIGQDVPTGLEFDATNEEIANAANVTPFTASRLLREWQNDHTLLKRRGKIILRSPKRLFLHTAWFWLALLLSLLAVSPNCSAQLQGSLVTTTDRSMRVTLADGITRGSLGMVSIHENREIQGLQTSPVRVLVVDDFELWQTFVQTSLIENQICA